MKTVRLSGNVVAEIIPDYALPVAKWYNEEFAAQCREAPDEVEQGWVYAEETGQFSPPPPPADPEPTPDEDRDELIVDLDYRVTILELGVM